jgi:hypothetical protein
MILRVWSGLGRYAAILLLAACSPGIAYSQSESSAPTQQTPPPQGQSSSESRQPPPSGTSGQDQKDKTQEQKTGTSNDRLFYALPDFLTVDNATQVPRLTAKQKFAVVARSSFDYVEYPWYGALAGISQAENSEPGYGQGAEGYAKRYGAAFADGTIENFWTSAILPSVLHQDPRFYQMPEGGFTHRTLYAASRIFVTRSDSGHRQFNFSEIFGSAIAAAISTYSYHPRADRTIGNTASVWGSQVGYDTITIEVKEFWPDIRRKLGGHKELDPKQDP